MPHAPQLGVGGESLGLGAMLGRGTCVRVRVPVHAQTSM